jgi:signal peptidase II
VSSARSDILPASGLSLSLAAAVAAADQLTKHWATDALAADPGSGPQWLGGRLALTYTTNSGAAFGLLADRNILFLFSGLIIVAVIALSWRYLPGDKLLLQISLGLQLGGAVGNLVDRVRQGYVVDFLQIRGWPVFNLADSAICCGVAMLMWYLLRSPSPIAAPRDQPTG